MDAPAPTAGSPLRPYQRRAVDELAARLRAPGARACLVAPPGSGKTRCALHVASELGRPLHVLAPTRGLVDQWSQRMAAQLIQLEEGGGASAVQTYAGMGPLTPGALVVLDEAHHLVATWGAQLADALGPEHVVLGLTATPPVGHRGWGRFVELVGEDPVIVDAPPLVRESHLSPYLDLVWPVVASPGDCPELSQVDAALREAERALGDDLSGWIARRLREDLLQLTEDRFTGEDGTLVALCRARHAAGLPLPLDLPRDPDLRAPPTLHDRALTLWAFAEAHPELGSAAREAVLAAGFKATRRGMILSEDVAWHSLSASQARLGGLKEVLRAEARARGDQLRALIITDRDREGDRLSARQVLRALVADAEADALDPILVSGTALWVDEDLWPRIAPRLPELPWEDRGDHHQIDVTAWPVEKRIALVTRFLHEGITRCLVGTRQLLGEGWDCPPVNCVIDLTGISRPVTVGQVRGRALRTWDGEPGKVASLWEILAVAPGISGGSAMLAKLAERHEHTLGLDDRGRIRAGLNRIDAELCLSPEAVAEAVPRIQERMIARLGALDEALRAWAVGRAYEDRRVWQVSGEVAPPQRTLPAALPLEELLGELTPGAPLSLVVRQERAQLRGWALAGAATAAAAVALVALTSPVSWWLAAALTALVPVGPLRAGRRREALGQATTDGALTALRDALAATGQVDAPLRRGPDGWWLDGPPEASRRFAEAAAELLGPVRYPRYLLVEPRGWAWPVPSVLGADRGLASAFGEAWARVVGPCEVIYARQGRGRVLLAAGWRAADQRAGVRVAQLWQ